MTSKASFFKMLTKELKNKSFNFYFVENIIKKIRELDEESTPEELQADKEYEEAIREFFAVAAELLNENIKELRGRIKSIDILDIFEALKIKLHIHKDPNNLNS